MKLIKCIPHVCCYEKNTLLTQLVNTVKRLSKNVGGTMAVANVIPIDKADRHLNLPSHGLSFQVLTTWRIWKNVHLAAKRTVVNGPTCVAS